FNGSSSWLAGATTGSLSLLILGAAFIVWAIEERERKNRVFAAVFFLLGLVAAVVAVRGLLLYARA
ncbi:MAG TPA: hypothetical protein VFB32_17920, partial [Rudaea sp.]|nr:hypothetical protein [Rudaea sp.]